MYKVYVEQYVQRNSSILFSRVWQPGECKSNIYNPFGSLLDSNMQQYYQIFLCFNVSSIVSWSKVQELSENAKLIVTLWFSLEM